MPGAPTTSRERFRDQQGVYVGTRTTISAARARGVGADAEVLVRALMQNGPHHEHERERMERCVRMSGEVDAPRTHTVTYTRDGSA